MVRSGAVERLATCPCTHVPHTNTVTKIQWRELGILATSLAGADGLVQENGKGVGARLLTFPRSARSRSRTESRRHAKQSAQAGAGRPAAYADSVHRFHAAP